MAVGGNTGVAVLVAPGVDVAVGVGVKVGVLTKPDVAVGVGNIVGVSVDALVETGVGVPDPMGALLQRKFMGGRLVPLYVPWKPKETLVPGATV